MNISQNLKHARKVAGSREAATPGTKLIGVLMHWLVAWPHWVFSVETVWPCLCSTAIATSNCISPARGWAQSSSR